ncbi:MAG TPA: hypothetical protein VF581_11385 [Flavobacterium sp.]|jgi:hypothetical protein
MKILSFFASFFTSKKATDKEVLQILREGAALATEDAKLYNYKLDYSTNSIKSVDNILLRLRKNYLNTNHEKELESFALVFGLYVIEVYERNHGQGYLQRKLSGHSKDDFPYYRKGKLIFPCIWCLNRLFDKNAEDIWVKYNSFI